MKKRVVSIILSLALCLSVVPVPALALEEDPVEKIAAQVVVVDDELPGNDELFAGYVEKMLYGGYSMFSVGNRTAGSQLTGDEKLAYDALVPVIQSIAAGTRASTEISLGKTVGTNVPDVAVNFTGDIDSLDYSAVIRALMADYPYEMYWYDKTVGCSISGYSGTPLPQITFSFTVALAYGSGYTADTTKTGATTTAITNANTVVSSNAGKSDYDKLIAYRDYICGEVTYNSAAADDSYTGGYGDPWQLVYVFDGNSATNVVCEGYAKAFQYLCDKTTWADSNIQCYTVTGQMSGGTGSGGHMWNIVTMSDGKNYLVDVTNSDSGSIGEGGGLFLAGSATTGSCTLNYTDGTSEILNGYEFTISSTEIGFYYDNDMAWSGADILTLAASDYVPLTAPTASEFTFTPPSGLTYDGNAKVAAVVPNVTGTGTVTVEYYKNGAKVQSAVDAGTYTVKINVSQGTNYAAAAGLTNPAWTFTIAKADPSVTAPTAKTGLTYTGSAQALINAGSTSGGEMEYSLDNSNWSATIPTATNAGTYTVYYKVLGGSNYNDAAPASITASIGKADPVVTAPVARSLAYTGSAQDLITEGSTTGGTMEYSLDGTSWSTAIPTGTNVGTYTVYYKVVGDSNYNDVANATVSVQISLADPAVTAPTAKTGLTYTGSAQALINAGSTSGGEMQYSLDNSNWSATIPTATNAGTYTVYYKVIGDANYNGNAGGSLQVTIGKATPSVTAPTAKTGLFYTGGAQALINAGSTTGGTMEYSLDNSTWSAAIPSETNAGSYTVYYRVVGNGNYNDVAAASVTASIGKTTLTVTADNKEMVTGDSLPALTYTITGFVGGDDKSVLDTLPTVSCAADGQTAGTYDITVSGGSDDNYQFIYFKGTLTVSSHVHNWTFTADNTGKTITGTCGNVGCLSSTQTMSFSVPTDLTYTGRAKEIVVTGSIGSETASITYTGTNATNGQAIDVGNYTATITVGSSDAITIDFSITKANSAVDTAPVSLAPTYNESAQPLVAAGTAIGGTMEYSLDNSNWSNTIPTATNAGTYTVYYKVVGDANHNDSVGGSVSVTIAPKTVTPTIELSRSVYAYDGMAKMPTVNVKDGTTLIDPSEYTVSYSDNTNAGTAKVTITDNPGGNYVVNGSTTFTISKIDAEVITAPAAVSGLTYNGSAQPLVIAGAATDGCEMQYRLDTTSWSTAIPTATNAGTYTVYYKVVGDANHNDNAGSSVSVTIAARTVTPTIDLSAGSFVYSGIAQTPAVTVKDGSTVIPAGEYTVSYADNINAGTATVTIADKADGNYVVNGSATFTIAKAPLTITADSLTIQTGFTVPTTLTYTVTGYVNGETDAVLTTKPTVTCAVTGQVNTPGDYDITVSGAVAANYDITYVAGKLYVRDHTHAWTFTASGATITATCGNSNCTAGSNTSITLTAPADLTYDGTQKAAAITGSIDAVANPAIVYDTADGNAPRNVGTYTARMTLGSAVATLQFVITPASLTAANVTVSGTYTYTGSEHVPTVVVELAGATLTADDYTVTASNNVNAGTATVTVTGKGNYTGTASGSFTIGKAEAVNVSSTTHIVNHVADEYQIDLSLFDRTAPCVWGNPAYSVELVFSSEGDLAATYGGITAALNGKILTIVVPEIESDFEGAVATAVVTVTSANYEESYLNISIVANNKQALTLTAANADKTYNAAAVALPSVVATLNGETVIPAGYNYVWKDEQGNVLENAPVNAGTYTLEISVVEEDAQYVGSTTLTVVISKAVVTITADDKYMYLGGQIPEFTYTVDGLAGSDVLLRIPELSTDADGKTAGKFVIKAANADAGSNYTVKYVNGTLWIDYVVPDAPAEETPNVDISTGSTVEGGSQKVETTVTPSVTTDGDSASAAITDNVGQQIVDAAVKSGSDEVVIAPDVESGVSSVEVSIPARTVGELAEQTEADLVISTPVADVTIPNDALDALSGTGGVVTITTERTGNTVTMEVVSAGKVEDEIPGGVTLTVSDSNCTPGTVAVIVHEDGTREVVRKSVADNGTVTIPLDGSATVEIVDNSKSFADVGGRDWFSDAVAFATGHQLFNGTSEVTFDPNSAMTRGMLAVVLHNLENNPDDAFAGGFSDVDSDSWYRDAVNWAAERGFVTGYSEDVFGGNDNITREQLAVILWRYAGNPTSDHSLSGFADSGEISDYAEQALAWANENGIINGKGNATLDPKGLATRAEVAQMLMNFLKNVL